MPRCRSRRDMTLLQAILDTEGFGEGEHPGSDSTLNTTSSAGSNPRRDPRAHQRNPCQASNPRANPHTHQFNPRTDPRVDPLDQALQQKQRELQLLLWQQHVERQVLMQRQMLQQEVVMQTSAYTSRRGKRRRQLRGPVHIPFESIPPPVQPHHTAGTTLVLTQVQKPQTKVESSTQTVETVTSAAKAKEDKTDGNRRKQTSKSRKEQDQERQKERRSKGRDTETSLKHRSEDDETRKSSDQDEKVHRKGEKITRKSAQILGEPKPEGQPKVRGRQEDKGQVKDTGTGGLRMSEGGKKPRGESNSEKRDHKGHRHGDQPGVAEDKDSSHHHGNKGHHHGKKDHHHGDKGHHHGNKDHHHENKDHHHGNKDHHHEDDHDENGNLHGDSSIKREKPHEDHDRHEVKGHLRGDQHDADGPSDVSDSDPDASDSESDSETARSCSSYSDSFSSCDDESTQSRKSSQKSGSEEGMTKRVTFAEEGRREEKKEEMKDRLEETPAGQKGVKEVAGKRKKPRQQSLGRKRTSTHPPFTVTSLSSRYLSLVSSLLQLQLNPQYPGKERARALSSPGKNISEEMLRKRAREEKKKRRMEKRQEEEEAASPREKQPFQPSDHDLKNSPNPQVQEWLQRKQAARRQQRRKDRAKRRLKFQMKLEERDLRIARMLESDEKVDQWMREKRKLLRRKPQKPRKAVVQPAVVQQAETEVTTPLGNSNQGQPDLPTLEKQAAQLEEKLLKDLGTETGQGDASTGSANGKGQGNTGLTNGKGDAISTNGKGDAISTNGKVGNSTTSPADGKVAGMDDFARRTVPAGRLRTENGAQPAGRVPMRPTTAPPRSGSPTKRRGKSLQPASAQSRGSKPSPESPGTTPRSSVSPRSTVSASGSPRDPMRNLSYDEWLLHKRQEDRQRRRQVKKQEADPELQSIIPELARRRVDRATAGKQKLDTGLKQRKQDSSREKPTDDQENKPRFVWRLRDDPTLERPSTTQPGSRSPTTTRAGSRSPSPGKKSPVRPSSPGKKSPARPSSPLKEPAFYRRQRFSREKMQLYSQRPEPQGSDCPDITTHDNDQSRGSIHTADQSQDSLYTANQSKASLHTADQSQGSLHTADQSEKGTTEAVVDQSEKGNTEVEVIDQPDEKKVDQSESATVKADSQSLSKAGSNQSAPACKTAGQSVNSLFAALGISDEIEENIESESESEDEERLSPSQTFITTVGDTGEGRG